MRYIVLADLHGNLDRLTAILEHSKFNQDNDTLVHIGDICDINPYTHECMDILEKYDAIELVGNHEMAHLLGHSITPYDKFLDTGDFNTRMNRKIVDRKASFVLELEGYVLSHAGISRDLYDTYDNFSAEDLNEHMYNLYIFSNSPYHALFTNEEFSPLWYRYPYDLKEHKHTGLAPIPQIFGHTPRSYYEKETLEFMDSNRWYVIDGYTYKGGGVYGILESGEVEIKRFDF